MNKRLDRFELLDQIDVGGYSTVYRAMENLGQGIQRPAAVKMLQAWNLEDEDQVRRLKREVNLLVEIGDAPNIVSVLGMGIDPEQGPWIAMELAGKSLRHAIEDKPAEPDAVRGMLRDVLHALQWVHGANPPILHRDLKPQNILITGPGLWKVADFGLAKRAGDEETMQLATVKYAAPELLDSTWGEESSRVDLYALGMIAYEMALGHDLFRKQFPSVYDLHADEMATATDDRPKWMYWHTSMQMALPSVGQLIEGYPDDLSSLIADMTRKTVAERVSTADEALARLGAVAAPLPRAMVREEEQVEEKKGGVSPIIAGAAALAVLVAGAAAIMMMVLSSRTAIEFTGGGIYEATAELISVSGTISNFPEAGRAQVKVGSSGGRTFPVDIASDGSFTCDVRLDRLGTFPAQLAVNSNAGKRVARADFEVVRAAPEAVEVRLETKPAIEGVSVELRPGGDGAQALSVRTDASGIASADVPFGSYSIEVFHPRYQPLPRTTRDTGIDRVSNLKVTLVPRDFAQLVADMQREIDRIMGLMRTKTTCPPGPLNQGQEAELAASVERLRLLADGDADIGLFLNQVSRAEDCNPATMVSEPPLPTRPDDPGGLDSDDPVAAMERLLDRIEGLIDRKVQCPPGPLSKFEERALAEALVDLEAMALGDLDILLYIDRTKAVKDCDPSSRPVRPAVPQAIHDLAEQKRLEREGPLAARRAAGAEADPFKGQDPEKAMERLLDRIEGLLDRKVQCPPGPLTEFEEQTLAVALSDLDAMAMGDVDILLYIDRVSAVKDCDPSSRPERPAVPDAIKALSEEWRGERSTDGTSGGDGLAGSDGYGSDGASGRNADMDALRAYIDSMMPPGAGGTAGAGGDAGGSGGGVGPATVDVNSVINRVLAGVPPNPALVELLTKTMTLDQFHDFVAANVPTGTLRIEKLVEFDALRLAGPLFDQPDLELLVKRLAYGWTRLQPELRIDAWEISRNLSGALSEDGAGGVRVDAYESSYDPTLFVQYELGGYGHSQAMGLARTFVVDSGLLWVRGYADEPVDDFRSLAPQD